MVNKHDKLAIASALQKRIKEQVDDLRGDVEAELLALNAELGVKQIAAKLGDKQIATISISTSKRVPVVTDEQKFRSWAVDRGLAKVERVVSFRKLLDFVRTNHPEILELDDVYDELVDTDSVLVHAKDAGDKAVLDGEIVDGDEFVGGYATGIRVGSLKVDDVVSELVRGTLPAESLFMLGAGDD